MCDGRVTDIIASASGVRLSVDTPLGAYDLDADWVVGCDGARSRVRDAAGLRLRGTSYEGRYVIVDIALRSTRGTERLAWFDAPSNPGSTLLMHRQPDDVWRIDYQLRDDEELTPCAEAVVGTVVQSRRLGRGRGALRSQCRARDVRLGSDPRTRGHPGRDRHHGSFRGQGAHRHGPHRSGWRPRILLRSLWRVIEAGNRGARHVPGGLASVR